MSLIVGRPRGRARDSPNRAWSERANGKILGKPNFGDGERDKLIGWARNRQQLACREHEDTDPHHVARLARIEQSSG